MATRIIRLQKKTEDEGFEIIQGIHCPKEAGINNPIQLGEFSCIIPLVNSPRDMQMKYVYAYKRQIRRTFPEIEVEIEVYNSIEENNLHYDETEIMLIVDRLNEEELKIYSAERKQFSVLNARGGVFFISPDDTVILEKPNMKKVYRAKEIESQMYLIELYDDATIYFPL